MFRDRDNKIVFTKTFPKSDPQFTTDAAIAVVSENKKFVLDAINNHDALVDVAEWCLSMFSNEANYPEGTIGYKLAQQVKNIFENIEKPEQDTSHEDMITALKRIESVYDWKEDFAGVVAHEVITKHKL